MLKAIKKLFVWTPADVAAWEKFRQPGMGHFVAWYGLAGFGGILFIITGAVTMINGVWASTGFFRLLFQLGVDGVACLAGGLAAGLLTWWLEDGIYGWIIKSRSKKAKETDQP